jgi:hypothetical protein
MGYILRAYRAGPGRSVESRLMDSEQLHTGEAQAAGWRDSPEKVIADMRKADLPQAAPAEPPSPEPVKLGVAAMQGEAIVPIPIGRGKKTEPGATCPYCREAVKQSELGRHIYHCTRGADGPPPREG